MSPNAAAPEPEQEGLEISVIIPTHRRAASLHRALTHLAAQGEDGPRFEVVVVDDGSPDRSADFTAQPWPFALHYHWQANAGATSARNRGADLARGELLIFMDDDIAPAPGAIAALAAASRAGTVLLGTLLPPAGKDPGGVSRPESRSTHPHEASVTALIPTPFTHCMTGLLAVRRDDWLALGRFQDPTGGWPNWDDVDFGYRADRAGMRILRHPGALAVHWDPAQADLRSTTDRWWQASHAAARLFQRHPGLWPHLPMFHDKAPIDWRGDPARLVLRKGARACASTRPAIALLRGAHGLARVVNLPESVTGALQRWLVGAHIYRGYRAGLRALAGADGRPADLEVGPC